MKTTVIAVVVGILVLAAANLSAQPVITTQPTNQTVALGGTTTFSVTVSGTGPFTYQWQFNTANLPNGVITTAAGNGTTGYSGDGGMATNVGLNSPMGVAVDASGNILIADTLNRAVHKMGTNGNITTMAGSNGIFGYSGDGSMAIRAKLNNPQGVCVDTSGNLFIPDTSNHRVRKVDTNSIITTVAGNGSQGFSGDGLSATIARLFSPTGVAVDASGNLLIADMNNSRIRKVDTNGIITTIAGGGNSGDGNQATSASLSHPYGVVLDQSGNLIIADDGHNRIRKVDTNGIITTIAGNGTSGYSGDGGSGTNAALRNPTDVIFDSFGDLFIADSNNNCIREVGLDGTITTVAGNGTNGFSGDGGAATNAKLSGPISVAVDASGNLFIADSSNYRIRNVVLFASYPTLTLNNVGTNSAGDYTVVVTSASGSVTSSVATLAVMVPAAPAITAQPTNQIVMAGGIAAFNVGVSGAGPFTYQWQLNGTNLPNSIINTVAGVGPSGLFGGYGGDGGLAIHAQLSDPVGVAVNSAGELFIADSANNRIRKVGTDGIITTVAGNGPCCGQMGSFSGDGGPATNASLYYANAVALDASGNLYITDLGNRRIRRVQTNGIITTVAGNGTDAFSGDGGPATNASMLSPTVLAVDSSGCLFISDPFNQRIRKVDTNGIITTFAGNGVNNYSGDGGLATNASLYRPDGVALAPSGNLFIADPFNQRIREVDTNGIISTFAGSGGIGYSGDGFPATATSLYYPLYVTMDTYGALYFDDGYSRICSIGTNGIITTVAGNGTAGYSGDSGRASNAMLFGPCGLAFDSSGNLFIADAANNRIREVLLFASHPTLKLSNVATKDGGNYTVVVSNAGGSVTSSVVTLTVALPPNIQGFAQSNGVFSFTWVAVSNLNYQVQYTTNLAPTNWVNLGSSITASNGTLSVSDPIADAQRFYRVVLLP